MLGTLGQECQASDLRRQVPMQQSWAASGQESLPATVQAAVQRAKLALSCCTSAAMTILQAACSARRPFWIGLKSVQQLMEALAGFLQTFASRPLPLSSSKRCSHLAVYLYPGCAPSEHITTGQTQSLHIRLCR